jgi:integrase/recombinase XerD
MASRWRLWLTSWAIAQGCSPNTIIAYAYDLRHLWNFLETRRLDWESFAAPDALGLLAHLRSVPVPRRRCGGPSVPGGGPGDRVIGLSPAAINRTLAAVSSFYEFTILAGCRQGTNLLGREDDRAAARVSERHRPFLDGIARQAPIRRTVRAKMVYRVPRPLEPAQVDVGIIPALLGHTTPRTAEQHYNHATSVLAARTHQQTIARLRRDGRSQRQH